MKPILARILFRLFLLALLGAGIWLWFALSPVRHAPGVLIRSAPIQTLPGSTAARPLLELEPVQNYVLSDVAGLHLHGRVLAAKRYRDPHARLAPLDVLIGWGPMSDTAYLRQLTFRLENRLSTFEGKGEKPPVPAAEIAHSTAHLHLIPANREIATFLGTLKVGMLVDFRGTVVHAQKGEFQWLSSLLGAPSPSHQLLLLQSAKLFDGNQDLAAKEAKAQLADSRASLDRWYQCLADQRAKLNAGDPEAVRAFNREAQRYMEAAHPMDSNAP